MDIKLGKKAARQGLTDDLTQMNFRLPVELKARLDSLVAARGGNLGSHIIAAIRWYLENASGDIAEIEALLRILIGGRPHLRAILRAVMEIENAYVWVDAPDTLAKRLAVMREGHAK